MINFSFFYSPRAGSGEIRGKQVGDHLQDCGLAEVKHNPTEGFEKDICIWVKTQPPEDCPPNTWLDILDEHRRIPWLKEHPEVGVIFSSLSGFEYYKDKLFNKKAFIPQHHCNYYRVKSNWKGGIVGVIGGPGAVIETLPFDYIHQTEYKSRKDIVEFYKTIDIQIIWRSCDRPLKNPLKIVNAMSFGIPTIASPEIAYKEVEGYYYKAETIARMEELLSVDLCFDGKVFMEKAEEYHIDNIVDMYLDKLT